jgi:hypothetical protein
MAFYNWPLIKKLLSELSVFAPKYCYALEDPSIDVYYMSINGENYLVLNGANEVCESITMYNDTTLRFNIMTDKGLFRLANNNYYNETEYDYESDYLNDLYKNQQYPVNSTELFELKVNEFEGNMDDFVKAVVVLIKQFVPF